MSLEPASCFQCGLPAPQPLRAEINGAERLFCCNGCRLAAELIQGCGLDSFYARREGFGLQPRANSEFPFDDPNFETSIASTCGLKREVVLTLDGLHCAACVWLIERVLGRTPGVVEVRVNFTARRVHLVWDPTETRLVTLTSLLSSLGYPPSPYDPTGHDRKARALNRDMLMRLGVGGLALTAAMYLGDPLTLGGFDETEMHLRWILAWTALILTTPAAIYVGWPFYRGAWTGLKAGAITMDLTITVAAILAYLTSVWTILTGAGPVYFDCLMTMLFLLLLGRQIEGAAKRKVFSQAERHWRLEAPTATLLEGDEEKSVPSGSIRRGDRLLVRPGEKVPVDGVILSGESLLDEAMLTGESLPISKAPGNAVTAGTLNLDGALVIQAERVGSETTLAQIVRWVSDADASRSPSQKFADRVSAIFLPTLLAISALTYWLNMHLGGDEALNRTMSVLIVTCPCALGLAIPAAVTVAMSRGAGEGILFKGGDQLEGLQDIKRLVFDKTGTLTTGQMKVLRVLPAPGMDEARVLEIAASLEALSEHPIAQAIAAEGKARGMALLPVQGFKALPGRGVAGAMDGMALRIGTLEWLGLTLPEHWHEPDSTATTVYVEWEQELLGAIEVADSVRIDAAETVQELKRRGISLTLLSGDRAPVVQQLADKLGMAHQAEVRPDAKRDVLMAMQQTGPVAMVGDGVNDAPALAIASIGIAMGRGAAISASAAGVVLLGNRLESLLEAFKLSEKTVRLIRSNLIISAIYNVVVIPIAAHGLIPPQLAAFLMPMSSLLVLGNSLRLSK